MDSYTSPIARYRKPKLPRKRKKAAIKAEGRRWYHNTIRLWKVSQDNPMLREPVCKFWVSAAVKVDCVVTQSGTVFPVYTPTKYW